MCKVTIIRPNISEEERRVRVERIQDVLRKIANDCLEKGMYLTTDDDEKAN